MEEWADSTQNGARTSPRKMTRPCTREQALLGSRKLFSYPCWPMAQYLLFNISWDMSQARKVTQAENYYKEKIKKGDNISRITPWPVYSRAENKLYKSAKLIPFNILCDKLSPAAIFSLTHYCWSDIMGLGRAQYYSQGQYPIMLISSKDPQGDRFIQLFSMLTHKRFKFTLLRQISRSQNCRNWHRCCHSKSRKYISGFSGGKLTFTLMKILQPWCCHILGSNVTAF